MQISAQQALNQAIAQFGGSLPTFIAVLLAWMNSNARIGDTNSRIGDTNSRIGDTNAQIRDLKADTKEQIKLLRDQMATDRKELMEFIRAENAATRDILRAEFRRVEKSWMHG